MRLTAMIQDEELQLMDTTRTVALRPVVRMGAGVCRGVNQTREASPRGGTPHSMAGHAPADWHSRSPSDHGANHPQRWG